MSIATQTPLTTLFPLLPPLLEPQVSTCAVPSTAPTAVVSATPSTRPTGLKFCVLGSGSGGNCAVVSLGATHLLIDAGFGPLTVTRRLRQAGLDLDRIAGICLTHLDQDHFRPHWVSTLLGWRIKVLVHRWHMEDFLALAKSDSLVEAGLVHVFDTQPFGPVDGAPMTLTPIRLPHDTKGTNGFLIQTPAGSIGYATDLGVVPTEMIERFAGVDLLAIESNYDPDMQRRSPRPAFLKQRIMGGQGHLSNQQSFEAVRNIVHRSPRGGPGRIVLLHRSAQCNDPALVRQVFAQDPALARRVTLTHQRRRSRWFTVTPAPAWRAAQFRLGF